MKRIILPVLLLVPLAGNAQNEEPTNTDSVAKTVNLNELVVEGRTQRVVKYGVEYMPGKKVKKAASDATSLLFYMQIPQLNVSPADNSVTTPSGSGVSMFIDYVPATPQDVRSLQPRDVLRVEVLDYPQDPRFNSSPHVVNFIMRKYEWGGYTKLVADGRFLSDKYAGGNVYEKFSWKDWTLDASVSASGSWSHKYRDYSEQTYRDITLGGAEIDEIKRTSATTASHGRKNAQLASLRAARSVKNSYISHTASFRREATPDNRRSSRVDYTGGMLPSSEAEQHSFSQSITVAAEGYYRFSLPKSNFLTAQWTFSHSGNRQGSSYRLANLDPVDNGNREAVYSPQVTLFYSKGLGHNNTLRTMVSSYANFFDTRYTGSYGGRQKLTSSESMVFLEYMQNWGFGLSLYSRVGASYVYGRLNGSSIMHEWSPRLGLQLQYKINSKNNISFDAWFANSHPQPATANSALVQTDELMWHQGNPDLKNIYAPMLTLSYSFVPRNNLSLFADAVYNRYAHAPVYLFHTLPDHDGLVRTYSDDNNEQEMSASAGASLRLFNNSLSMFARGRVNRIITTGFHPLRETYFTATAQVSYFIRNLSLTLYYETPSKRIINTSGYIKNLRCSYGLIVSYAVGNFNARLHFNDWFGKGRVYGSYTSPQFDSSEWHWVNGYARGLSLTLTYTFPYGKKIERREDLENNAYRKSAILE